MNLWLLLTCHLSFWLKDSFTITRGQQAFSISRHSLLCESMSNLLLVSDMEFDLNPAGWFNPFTHKKASVGNSPYLLPYNHRYFGLENLVFDQPIIPSLIFFFILITCLLSIVLWGDYCLRFSWECKDKGWGVKFLILSTSMSAH